VPPPPAVAPAAAAPAAAHPVAPTGGSGALPSLAFLAPSDCIDVSGWKDLEGASCYLYASKRWCTPSGDYGSGWGSESETFESFSNGGHTAKNACCACGGGLKKTLGADLSAQTTLTTTTPSTPTAPKAGLFVAEGPCTVDRRGCALSPNWPTMYSNSQHCTIKAFGDVGTLSATTFLTEKVHDYLQLGMQRFSGRIGPRYRLAGTIEWSSDAKLPSRGWRLCPDRIIRGAGKTSSSASNPSNEVPPSTGSTGSTGSKATGQMPWTVFAFIMVPSCLGLVVFFFRRHQPSYSTIETAGSIEEYKGYKGRRTIYGNHASDDGL